MLKKKKKKAQLIKTVLFYPINNKNYTTMKNNINETSI